MRINSRKFLIPAISIAVTACLSVAAYAYGVSDSLIKSKWLANGGSTGFLGNPTTNTLTTPNGLGYYNHFDGGSIYRKKTFNEAFTVYGLNRAKWSNLGWENSFLGFPTTDESDTYNKGGRFNHFEGGSIYYKNGANESFEVHGDIRSLWSWLGWETSQLGYPTSDEHTIDNNNNYRSNRFDNGAIYWYYTPASTGGMISFPASTSIGPVMTVAKGGQGTPFGTQKINSVSAYFTGTPVEFPDISISASGSGFPANKKVTVRLSTVGGSCDIGTATANSSGSFSLTGYIYLNGGRTLPAVNGVVTVWAQSESGPAAIYSYKPTTIGVQNYTLK